MTALSTTPVLSTMRLSSALAPIPDARRAPSQRRGRVLRAMLFGVAVAVVVVLGRMPAAHAFDPATTHAGLTTQAVAASNLSQVLGRRLARPLGMFEPIALHPELLAIGERRLLQQRLGALDPAGGYRPGDDGVAPAVAWVVAGAVIAKTPPERVQHLYFDPSTGQGLRDAAALDGFFQSLRAVADAGGSLRAVATGTNFTFEGQPSVSWMEAPDNDVGLPVFYDQLERAIADPDPAARGCALARALLALGGVLTVLEDAGNPAQVRNDFRASYLRGRAGSPFDRWSPFERAVADSFGVGGVPAAKTVVHRANVRAFFTDADGQGLADRTQRRFFSDGTLPEDGVVDHDTTPADIVRAARASLTYALPTVPRLELRELGQRRYVTVTDGPGQAPRRILGYERVPGRVRFFLDGRVYADTARALLPEIVGYAAGLVDHLLRAEVRLTTAGDRISAQVLAPAGKIRDGVLRIFVDDAAGKRRELGAFPTGDAGNDGTSVEVPADATRVAAVLRGRDDAGPVVAFGELALPSRR